uniref:Uncharacterized protein n=1 Tax=Anguilla anguilla TaxID=7936 RepID=A0A0E9VPR5_ANGAN
MSILMDCILSECKTCPSDQSKNQDKAQ